MMCLSLMQPWATLVVSGAKRCETRTWQTAHRGPLAIHASRRFPESARLLCLQEPFRSALMRAGFRQPADLPMGVVLGAVEMLDCLPVPEVAARLADDPIELAFGDYQLGRWVWQFADPRPLVFPLPATGRLGLFTVPEVTPELPSPALGALTRPGSPSSQRR